MLPIIYLHKLSLSPRKRRRVDPPPVWSSLSFSIFSRPSIKRKHRLIIILITAYKRTESEAKSSDQKANLLPSTFQLQPNTLVKLILPLSLVQRSGCFPPNSNIFSLCSSNRSARCSANQSTTNANARGQHARIDRQSSSSKGTKRRGQGRRR